MKEREYIDFLEDIVNACRAIISFVDGMTIDDYFADEKTRFAVMHGYEIIGEAAKRLPEEIKFLYSHIPWSKMIAVRNHIAHGYFSVDDVILFETIERELKPLLPQLEAILSEQNNSDSL